MHERGTKAKQVVAGFALAATRSLCSVAAAIGEAMAGAKRDGARDPRPYLCRAVRGTSAASTAARADASRHRAVCPSSLSGNVGGVPAPVLTGQRLSPTVTRTPNLPDPPPQEDYGACEHLVEELTSGDDFEAAARIDDSARRCGDHVILCRC